MYLNDLNYEIKHAIIAYIVLFILTCLGLYYGAKFTFGGAFIISIVISQVFLNVIFMPTKIDFFSEFNSYVAIYCLIQFLAPIIIYIYAITMAINSRNRRNNLSSPS